MTVVWSLAEAAPSGCLGLQKAVDALLGQQAPASGFGSEIFGVRALRASGLEALVAGLRLGLQIYSTYLS